MGFEDALVSWRRANVTCQRVASSDVTLSRPALESDDAGTLFWKRP